MATHRGAVLVVNQASTGAGPAVSRVFAGVGVLALNRTLHRHRAGGERRVCGALGFWLSIVASTGSTTRERNWPALELPC